MGRRRLQAVLGVIAVALAATPDRGQAQGVASEVRADMSVRTLYLLRCGGCHGAEGHGASAAGIPEFRRSVSRLARFGAGRRYMLHVPGVAGSGLDDRQKAEVMNYILAKWGDGEPPSRYTEAEVAELKRQPIEDIVGFRRRLVEKLSRSKLKVATYPWP